MIFFLSTLDRWQKQSRRGPARLPVSCWRFPQTYQRPILNAMGLYGQLFTDVLFLVLKRIADGDTEPGGLRSTEFKIVSHDIHVRLRPDENSIGDIKAHRPAELAEEVIAADEIGTAGKSAAGQKWRIKTDALGADSSRQFQLCAFPQRWRVNQVNIIEKRTEGLETLIKILLGAE